MGKIGIKDIMSSKNGQPLLYEGYLWYSNRETPEILDKQALTLPEEGTNPFVVEGQLYNESEGLSYSIKYVDGQYIVHQFQVKDAPKDTSLMAYLPNRMGNRRLLFLRCWEEVFQKDNVDGLGGPEGLPVLMQAKNVFVGFKKQEDAI